MLMSMLAVHGFTRVLLPPYRMRVPLNKPQPARGLQESRLVKPDERPLDGKALRERLFATFRSADYKPPMLPAVAMELMALTRRPDVGAAEVTKTLERDPLLAAAVLKLAQSSAYASRIAPSSLSQAVQRLGLSTVRDMVFQVVLDLRVFRADGYKELMERVRRHSVVTAHIMRLLCGHTALAADQAFLCGLLHDVGLGGSLLVLGDMPIAQRPPLTAMSTALSDMHHDAGAMMARVWQISGDVQFVIQHHHDFDPQTLPHPLIAALSIAESLADDIGFGVNDINAANNELAIASATIDRFTHHQTDDAYKLLGISTQVRALIQRDATTLAGQVLAGK